MLVWLHSNRFVVPSVTNRKEKKKKVLRKEHKIFTALCDLSDYLHSASFQYHKPPEQRADITKPMEQIQDCELCNVQSKTKSLFVCFLLDSLDLTLGGITLFSLKTNHEQSFCHHVEEFYQVGMTIELGGNNPPLSQINYFLPSVLS